MSASSHATESTALAVAVRLRLRAALFLAGAAVMVLEILGTRIIGPHFGVGLYVWTSLITVTLVALALGYWSGGVLADRRPSLTWFAGVLLAAAVAIALIPLLRGPVLDAGWRLGLRTGSLAASAALFFAPLMLLGMVSPYAIRLEAAGVAGAGRSAGRLYAISTVGSVAGAVLAGFVLVPNFRIPTLLALLAATLAFAALLAAAPGFKKRVALVALGVALGAPAIAMPVPMPPGLLDVRNHQGTDLRVVSHKGSRYLFVDQAVQSSVNADGRALEKYIYFMASRILLARPDAQHATLIGIGGGGIVPLLTANGIDLECVDLAPEVIALARAHFGFSVPPEKVHAMDGRVFLKERPGSFDVVVIDVFNGDIPPFALFSREGLETAKAALTPGGMLALNTWGVDLEQGRPNKIGAAIQATLQQVFAHVLAVPAAGNLLFFASDEPISPARSSVTLACFDGSRQFTWLDVPPTNWPDAPVLTDNWNPVDVLDTTGLESLRASRHATFPNPVRAALAWE